MAESHGVVVVVVVLEGTEREWRYCSGPDSVPRDDAPSPTGIQPADEQTNTINTNLNVNTHHPAHAPPRHLRRPSQNLPLRRRYHSFVILNREEGNHASTYNQTTHLGFLLCISTQRPEIPKPSPPPTKLASIPRKPTSGWRTIPKPNIPSRKLANSPNLSPSEPRPFQTSTSRLLIPNPHHIPPTATHDTQRTSRPHCHSFLRPRPESAQRRPPRHGPLAHFQSRRNRALVRGWNHRRRLAAHVELLEQQRQRRCG